MESTVIFATTNVGKANEVAAFLNNTGIHIQTLSDLNLNAPDETGLTFVENAILKARYAAKHAGMPALADDSGLVVPALKGAPGLYSARYAGESANAQDNITLLLENMRDIRERNAYFISLLVYLRYYDDPDPIICEGRWHGSITQERIGTQGFGYDPVFYVPSLNKTAAECSLDEKNLFSHRGQALCQLREHLMRETLIKDNS